MEGCDTKRPVAGEAEQAGVWLLNFPLEHAGGLFGKPSYRQITGLNFSKNREVSHNYG